MQGRGVATTPTSRAAGIDTARRAGGVMNLTVMTAGASERARDGRDTGGDYASDCALRLLPIPRGGANHAG